MKIKTNNIIAAVLAIGALAIFIRHHEQATEFLSTVERIGPGNSPQDMTCGLIVIGICGVTLVAVIRLLINRKN